MTSPLGFLDLTRMGAWMRERREHAGAGFLAPGAPPTARVVVLQSDVAAGVGVEHNTIARWEAGRTQPNIEQFVAWAQALGLDPGDAIRALIEAAGIVRPL